MQWQTDVAIPLDRIGYVKLRTDPAAALVAFQESLDIRRKRAVLDPDNGTAWREVSIIPAPGESLTIWESLNEFRSSVRLVMIRGGDHGPDNRALERRGVGSALS